MAALADVDSSWKDVRRWPRRRSLPLPSGSPGMSSGDCWASGPTTSASCARVCPVLRVAFQAAARSVPRRRRIMLSGPAFNELMSLVFTWPRPEQSDRGVVGFASVRRSVLERQVFLEEAERGGPAAPERVHAGCRLDSDLGQPRGCAFSRCELGGVACQGACCALA